MENGIVSELILRLRDGCDHVNLFLIVIKGWSRMDKKILEMIQRFEELFPAQFWSQAVVVSSNMSMNEDKKADFLRTKKKTYEGFATSYLDDLKNRFPQARDVRYLILDACYENTESEQEAFDLVMEILWN